MDAEFKQKWVAALRSGEYQQGEGFLLKDDTYCCLGVACRVVGYSEEQIFNKQYIPPDFDYLPNELKGVYLSTGEPQNELEILIKMNDQDYYDFNKIADYIEKNL